jgi:hypothetical protein
VTYLSRRPVHERVRYAAAGALYLLDMCKIDHSITTSRHGVTDRARDDARLRAKRVGAWRSEGAEGVRWPRGQAQAVWRLRGVARRGRHSV